MRSEAPAIETSEIAAPQTAGEPYRYDERASSTGASQADLAPVSPEPAASLGQEPEPTTDPMGASPAGDEARDGPEPQVAGTEVQAPRAEAASAAEAPPAGAPNASVAPATLPDPDTGVSETREIETGLEASPQATLYWQDVAGASHETKISTDLRMETSALVPQQTEPSIAAFAPVSSLADAPAVTESAFSDMAARIDEMMADMMDRIGGETPADDGPAAPADGALPLDRFEGDPVRDALDEFEASVVALTDELDSLLPLSTHDLLGSMTDAGASDAAFLFGAIPAGGLLSTLFTPGADDGSPFAGPPILADSPDVDHGLTELLAVLDDDDGLLSGFDHDGSSASLWDHFDDLG